jgi:hypothetical protein
LDHQWYFSALLPVIWAVVSTIIALVLYRTSSAFFMQNDVTKTRTRRIRLVGSVVIAALTFLGLRYATPTPLLPDPAGDRQVVRKADVAEATNAMNEMGDTFQSLESCIARSVVAQCPKDVADLRTEVAQAQAANARLSGGPEGK